MKADAGNWIVELKDESAPTEKRRFATELEACKVAEDFGTTKRKRAYVYDPEGHLFGWHHERTWHYD